MAPRGRALRIPAFRRLWAAQLVSEAGDWTALIAASALLYLQHRSAVEAGLVFVAGLLPQVGIGQWLSTYADRRSRRAIMLLADALRCLAFLLLGFGGPALPVPVVLLVLFLAACATEPFNSARSAALIDLTPPADYESAVWVDSLTQDLTQILGFALGGSLLLIVSPATGLLVDAGTFAVSFLLVVGLPGGRPTGAQQASARASSAIRAAVRHLVADRLAVGLIVTAVLSEAVATGVDATVVPFATGLGAGFRWLPAVVLGGSAAATLAVTAVAVHDVGPAKAVRLVQVLAVLPVLAVPLLLRGAWWSQALGMSAAALLSVSMVPAAMVVNPRLPAHLRATSRSVIVGCMVLCQAGAVAAVTGLLPRFGVGPTIAVAFGLVAGACPAVLWAARTGVARDERHLSQQWSPGGTS